MDEFVYSIRTHMVQGLFMVHTIAADTYFSGTLGFSAELRGGPPYPLVLDLSSHKQHMPTI